MDSMEWGYTTPCQVREMKRRKWSTSWKRWQNSVTFCRLESDRFMPNSVRMIKPLNGSKEHMRNVTPGWSGSKLILFSTKCAPDPRFQDLLRRVGLAS